MQKQVMALLLAASCATGSVCAEQSGPRLENPDIVETSGIAVSQLSPENVWAINDSGHHAQIFLVDPEGKGLGSVSIEGQRNRDWEDLDSFKLNEQAYLLIADTGDNSGRRAYSQLILVQEPPADPEKGVSGMTKPLVVTQFRYEDGPRDCEAVAVDIDTRRILLIGKRTSPPPIYEIPLNLVQGAPQLVVARKIGHLAGMPGVTAAELLDGPLGPWRYQPTGLAIHPGNQAVAVVTYQGVYLYSRKAGENWVDAMSRQPESRPFSLTQAEAVTFDSRGILVIPEGRHAPLIRMPFSPDLAM